MKKVTKKYILKKTVVQRYKGTLSLPKICGSHSGEDGADFSTREKEENLGTYIHLASF
jgi:hypothetical protein